MSTFHCWSCHTECIITMQKDYSKSILICCTLGSPLHFSYLSITQSKKILHRCHLLPLFFHPGAAFVTNLFLGLCSCCRRAGQGSGHTPGEGMSSDDGEVASGGEEQLRGHTASPEIVGRNGWNMAEAPMCCCSGYGLCFREKKQGLPVKYPKFPVTNQF